MSKIHPLRAMHDLDDALESHSGYTGTARWMIPYADFLTLLLGFFVILFAMIKMENKDLTQEAEKAKKTLAIAQQRLEELHHDHAVQEGEAGQLIQSKSLYQLPQSAATPTDQVSLQDLEDSLMKDLKLKGHQVTVSQDARGLVISFQERLFFQPGQATLSPQAEATLDKLAGVLQQAHHPIRVEGHTDNTPIRTAKFPYNWELSTTRATTIVRDLVERHHFSPQELSAAGFGEYYPLADNSTIEGKQKNRRVDIVLLNPMSELPSPKVGSSQPRTSPAKE